MACLLVVISGCGSDGDDEPEAVDALRATIGAAGGTIAGKRDTIFEGLKLVIAPGALAATTEIVITPTVDDTELPLGAQACGPTFALAPQALALAAPASLTLPVAADMPAYLGHRDDDVDVWGRTADGWMKSEATATTKGSVTISITSLTTFAAGVKVVPIAPACSTIAGCISADGTCTSTNGFCVTSLGVPVPRVASSNIASDGKALFYTAASSTGTPQGVRYDLTTRTVQRSTALGVNATLSFTDNTVVDANGAMWTATSAGNIVFPFSGSPIRYDIASTDLPYGMVTSARGALVRITAASFFVRSPFGFVKGALGDRGGRERDATSDPTAPDSFWTTAGHAKLQRFSVTDLTLEKTVTLPLGTGMLSSGSFSVAPNGTLAVHAIDPEGNEVLDLIPPTGSPQVVRDFPVTGTPRYDAQGALWIPSPRSPELFILRSDGGLESLRLTATTDIDSPDYVGHLAKKLRVLPDGSIVVVTFSGEVLRIRRSG